MFCYSVPGWPTHLRLHFDSSLNVVLLLSLLISLCCYSLFLLSYSKFPSLADFPFLCSPLCSPHSQALWWSCLLHTSSSSFFFLSLKWRFHLFDLYARVCVCLCVSACVSQGYCQSPRGKSLYLCVFTGFGRPSDGYPPRSRATSPGILVGQLLFSYHAQTHTPVLN